MLGSKARSRTAAIPNKGYYVCNPTTNKYLKLPQIHDKPDWMLPMCLAFDPSKSPHYKVVCALRLEPFSPTNINPYQFLVYSSETGCWGKSCVEPFEASVNFQRGVYWNGAMHWVSFKNTGKSIYFDPDDDRMSLEIMPTPPILHNPHPNYFGESCGHLHYIENCWNWRMDVYELRRDYSEWFVKYKIDDPSFSVEYTPFLCAVVRGKSHDDSFSVLLIKGKLVRYNFLHNTHDIICEAEGSPLEECFSHVPQCLPLQHTDSLCSV